MCVDHQQFIASRKEYAYRECHRVGFHHASADHFHAVELIEIDLISRREPHRARVSAVGCDCEGRVILTPPWFVVSFSSLLIFLCTKKLVGARVSEIRGHGLQLRMAWLLLNAAKRTQSRLENTSSVEIASDAPLSRWPIFESISGMVIGACELIGASGTSVAGAETGQYWKRFFPQPCF